MMIDIKQALKDAVEQGVKGGRLGRREFIEKLAGELKDLGLDVRTAPVGSAVRLDCEMDKDETPGFSITFESRSLAIFEPNKFAVSSHGEPINMMKEDDGQKKICEATGRFLVENSPAERLDAMVPHRQKQKVLAL